jgi:putative DNA primase/helicase
MQDKIDRLNFFTALYKFVGEGQIETRQLPSKIQKFHTIEEICNRDFTDSENVFFGVASRNGGGTKEDILQIPTLWIDIDFKDTPEREAETILNECPCPPNIIVESGGGLHCYWPLKEPLEKEDIASIESYNRRLAHYFKADTAAAEAARVMRVPGTYNHKYNPPRKVRVKKIESDLRYDPSDFDEWLPEEKASSTVDSPHLPAGDDLDFNEGSRDNTLFHLANQLVKSNTPQENIEKYLMHFAATCNPPFSKKEVLEKIKSAIKRHKQSQDTVEADYKLTDTGNGERFADQHREYVRFCYPAKSWFFYNGKRWEKDETGTVKQLAKQTVRNIYREASKVEDNNIRASIGKWAHGSESEPRKNAMIASAQSEPSIPILPDEFDTHTWLFNVLSGTLDLRANKLLPHTKDHFITKLAPVEYNPDATCPQFLVFLYRIMDGNEEKINFLKRTVGYSLTANTGEQCLFFLWGTGANGKSTLLTTLQNVMGDYASQTPFSTFTAKKQETVRNDIARMKGARLVCAIETNDRVRLDEALIKQLTGGDKVAARFLHQEYFEYIPESKIFLAANYKPTIYGQDKAIWRRIRLIPFTVEIPEDEQDPDLPEKLLEERSGILNWALEGCLEWQNNRLQPPDEVKAATAEYKTEMDILKDFMDDQILIGPELKTPQKDVYNQYVEWCQDNNETKIGRTTFNRNLEAKGYTRKPYAGVKHWYGIALKKDIVG